MDKRQASISLSLFDVWLRYEAHLQATLPEKKAEVLLAQTRTALLRYTLPGWGFSLSKGQRLTAQEREQGLQFLQQIRLEQLQEAPAFQEKSFEELNVAGNSRRNYRWALNNFIDWCKQQTWAASVSWAEEKRVTPRKREKKGSAVDLGATHAKSRLSYRLPKEQISASLQEELVAFRNFLTKEEPCVSGHTAQMYEQQVLRLLGWLHQVQGIPLEDLSLETIVPKTSARDEEYASSLAQAYLQWLQDSRRRHTDAPEHELISPHTAIKAIDAWLTVAKFVYRKEIEVVGRKNKEKIPVLQVLYSLRRYAVNSLKSYQRISHQQKDPITWTEFLELGEFLRDECKPWFLQSIQSKRGGATRGTSRSLTAIAQSYQRFLCLALLSYIPPPRLGELRQLKISLPFGSDLEHITNNVHTRENLLYYDGSQWWIRIVNKKYEQMRAPDRRIPIPNIRYENNRCFYQYLEEWLLHYDYRNDKEETLSVLGLRSCLNPQHDYLFTLKNGKPYNSSSFGMLLTHAVRRITEKHVPPARQMFFSYVRETNALSSGDMENLALSMGHHIHHLITRTSLARTTPSSEQQWAAEIAQAFVDERCKRESPLHRVEVDL
ncbi:hypothetical protein [Leptolyngbya sp. FACHB-711]|uniref:hypothetical protein n=1 Tax=Leptolyngbya sp. FACHB-711 TaxID=2692813 RepID=UPI001683E8A9|nr:hypothetical protein [Leptolyngbya sp. FACHB-711]MBD2028272.1 hypothetical protein [Leptolyngbya sp. FACHB-711]